MPAKHLEVAGVGFVSIYKRRNAKAIKITILPAGGVRVTLPSWLPYRAGLEYTKSKATWIKQHQPTKIKLLNGKRIGKYHRLAFMPSANQSVTSKIGNGEVIVFYPTGSIPSQIDIQTKAIAACEKALRQEALMLLPQRLAQLAAKYSYSYTGIAIKKLKSRWGSCNQHHQISLSLFLMQLPWQLIDYVLVHELNHTKHLNHSPQFWAEMERHMPNAKALRRQLRVYQPSL